LIFEYCGGVGVRKQSHAAKDITLDN
jgi:hypothetical protein